MGLFKKKGVIQSYDKQNKKPVIKASICNGEQVAGFKDIHTGKVEEVMLMKSPADLEHFKAMYGIDEEMANGGLENMVNWDGKDKDLLALIKYTADEDKLEKVLENPQVIKTPVVRNGKQSTLGYQPDVWKGWN